jgi:hypothetical protein
MYYIKLFEKGDYDKLTGFVEKKNKLGLYYPCPIYEFNNSLINIQKVFYVNWDGNWDGIMNIKQCLLPLDAFTSIKRIERIGYDNYVGKTNKIILGETYALYDIRTIKKFNIHINESFITGASKNGHVNILEWWLKNNLELKYNEDAIDEASGKGHVKVLEWWKNSGLELKYTRKALESASQLGHIDVLDWWKNSGLPLYYSDIAFDYTIYSSCKNMIEVHEWWITSGLKVKSGLLKESYIGVDKNWENIFV